MSLDLQPVLTGPTLTLRPLRPEDRDALYAVASDPAIWALHPAHDRHLRPVFDVLFDESLESGGALLVADRASGAAIGSSRFSFRFAEPGEVEIGWTFLARGHWGGATNRELKRLMLSHAFAEVATVMFRVGEDNLRSRRALEKIGARLTARTQLATVAGREVVHVVYAMERGDFPGSPLYFEAER
ncbi:GNAT family N-acetyltransferase [Allosphingosinicella sp.]|uniref:GNAT family N-acetyltransferase n=1 Tax=Allosphingosinicella sp. TaxID=2823234 RepID=UPI002F047018